MCCLSYRSTAASSSGVLLVAGVYEGYIYTSNNTVSLSLTIGLISSIYHPIYTTSHSPPHINAIRASRGRSAAEDLVSTRAGLAWQRA